MIPTDRPLRVVFLDAETLRPDTELRPFEIGRAHV